ncbi:MAG: DnaB-like helicase C-terminal domain-containing protein, partial [candidate division Zixibacteria bacterium]|nr:DnaB-like helicase C-terminal domain-containing protein [candidate division Zixibacteria bacterium]
LCSHARLSSHRMRIGKLSDREWANLSIAAGPLSEAKIFIDDTPAIGLFELRAKARRLKHRENIGMLVIDYLQLMQGPRNVESRQQEISAICQSLKSLAKELDIPVMAISQLSRKTEDRTDKKPQLADLRESGSIEQDADLVLLVYRPEFYEIQKFRDGSTTEGAAEIIIAKHRNGPTGDIKLAFVKDYARFENLELRFAEEQVPPF